MSKLTIMIATLLSIGALSAQEQTLLGKNLVHGGYGSWGVQLSQVNGELAYMSTSEAKWLINHRFSLGFAGQNIIGSVAGPLTAGGQDQHINMDVGGIDIGYIFTPNNIIHAQVNLSAGLGEVSYHSSDLEQAWWSEDDLIASIVPSVKLMVNLTTYLHAGIHASYRLVSGVDLEGLTDSDLSAPNLGFMIEIGKF